MKRVTKKQVLAFLMVLAVLFIFATCDLDKDNSKDDGTTGTIIDEDGKKVCACAEKEHLKVGETCGCGGEGCNCTLKTHGFLTEFEVVDGKIISFDGKKIPIYQLGNFAKGNTMEDAVATLQREYDGNRHNLGVNLVGKITEVHIYDLANPNDTQFNGMLYYKKDGDKLILGIRYDIITAPTLFEWISNGTIQPTIVASQHDFW